jgi:hypothetical protein
MLTMGCMSATLRRSPWPTALQLELLRVALWPPDAATRHWERLRTGFVLDDVWDPDTYRLLPLVHRRLVALGVDDPVLPRLKGVHRREWYRNRVTVSQVAPVLDRLERAGIPTMVLRGVPLATTYYDELGTRPIDHATVLVRPADAPRALQLLGANASAPMRSGQARLVAVPGGGPVEVRWQLGAPFVLPGRELQSDDGFWARAEPTEVGGVATRRLRAGDQLLDVVVDGIVTPAGGSAQWCADAAFVLSADVDWDELVALTGARRLAPVVDAALGYLVDALDVAVPAEVQRRLVALGVTRLDRRALDRSLESRPSGIRGLVDLGPEWAWRRAKLGRLDAVRDAPGYLGDTWELPPHRVPGEAARRLRRRLTELSVHGHGIGAVVRGRG